MPSTFQSKRPLATAAVAALVATLAAAQGKNPYEEGAAYGRNFDLRATLPPAAAPAPSPAQVAAAASLAAAVPGARVELDGATGASRKLWNPTGYLTGEARAVDAATTALDFLAANLALLGLEAADLDDHEVTDDVRTAVNGSAHLYLRQRHAGIAVYNGQLQVNLNRDGRILSINNQFVPRLAAVANATEPALTAEQAIAAAAGHLGIAAMAAAQRIATYGSADRRARLLAPELSLDPVETRLMYLPVGAGARLVWNLQVRTLDDDHWYDMTVDALDGRVWTRFDWVADADEYRVYPPPVESPLNATPPPPGDGRVLEVSPALPVASPFGWHDTDGSAGPEYTWTRGNNVHAWEDSDGNNSEPPAPPTGETDCGATISCDFPIDLTMEPSAYRPAAVANLFYWNNVIHDTQYLYGFDEAGGNFQDNLYGNPGTGNDHVRALAQSGAGTCNANFSTPPDGSTGRMRMYICDHDGSGGTPNRDGDIDNIVITHEYGHGISNRLVGGPSNVSCLGNTQQPGEGLSDWWGLVYTHEPGDLGTDERPMGLYLIGHGIRPQPYSTDPAINSYTYETIGSGVSIPHGVGSVWAQAAWEVYWALVDAHGFNPDIYDSTSGEGNIRALHYLVEGLKNSACSPTFLDVRDGILQAAVDNYGGEDVCRMWEAFAAFGLGDDATTVGPSSTNATNGFAVPVACSFGSAGDDARICAGDPHVQDIFVGPAFSSPPVDMSVAGNPAGTSAVFSEDPVPAVPATITLTIGNTGAVAAGTYTIEVTGDDGVAPPYVDSFDLTVDDAVPAAPPLVSPADATSGHSVRPPFAWDAVAGAAEYLLEIDDDADLASPFYTTSVTGTGHTPATNLPTGAVLYWRVTPSNACGAGAASATHYFATSAGEFCSGGGSISLPNGAPGTTSGPASPYPSTLAVSGASVDPGSVAVKLMGLSHTFPDDLDFLLVSPSGQTLVFMSDIGGSGDVVSIDLTIDDGAATLLSDSGPLVSGAYRPSNVGASDPFDAPAPAGPYGLATPAGGDTLASVFGTGDPNGTWNLYIDDDAGSDSGSMADWCLELPVAMPFVDGFESGDTGRWSDTVTPP